MVTTAVEVAGGVGRIFEGVGSGAGLPAVLMAYAG